MTAEEETSATGSPSKKALAGLTDREMHILSKAWLCMKTAPEIDINKLAQLCGMTNPRSAGNAWATIKKKLVVTSQETPSPKVPKPAAKPAPQKPTGKRSVKDEDSDIVDGDDSPNKKPRRRMAPKKKSGSPGAAPSSKEKANGQTRGKLKADVKDEEEGEEESDS